MDELLVRSSLEDRVSALERLTTTMRQDLNPIVRLTDQLTLMQGVLGPVGKMAQMSQRLDVFQGQAEEAVQATRQMTSRTEEWDNQLSRVTADMYLRLKHVTDDFVRTRAEVERKTKQLHEDLRGMVNSVRHCEKNHQLMMMMARGETLPPDILNDAFRGEALPPTTASARSPISSPRWGGEEVRSLGGSDYGPAAVAGAEALTSEPAVPQIRVTSVPSSGVPVLDQGSPLSFTRATSPSSPAPSPSPNEAGGEEVPPPQSADDELGSGRDSGTEAPRVARPWRPGGRVSPSAALVESSPGRDDTSRVRFRESDLQAGLRPGGEASPGSQASGGSPASALTGTSTVIDADWDDEEDEDAENFERMATDSYFYYC